MLSAEILVVQAIEAADAVIAALGGSTPVSNAHTSSMSSEISASAAADAANEAIETLEDES